MKNGQQDTALASDVDSSDERHSLLGRFEEAIVLAAIACGPLATAGAIKTRIASYVGDRHINCVLTTLDRLSRKGMVESNGKAESNGLKGRRRKTYQVTPEGRETVQRGVAMVANLAREAGMVRAA